MWNTISYKLPSDHLLLFRRSVNLWRVSAPAWTLQLFTYRLNNHKRKARLGWETGKTIYRWDLLCEWRVAPSTHVGLLWSVIRFSSNSLTTPEAREMHRSQPLINFAWSLTTKQPVLRALSSQNMHLLTYPSLSRLLQQAEICFRPILYDARNSHRAFGKQHLEKCHLLKL
jgi:hypothetical protein